MEAFYMRIVYCFQKQVAAGILDWKRKYNTNGGKWDIIYVLSQGKRQKQKDRHND